MNAKTYREFYQLEEIQQFIKRREEAYKKNFNRQQSDTQVGMEKQIAKSTKIMRREIISEQEEKMMSSSKISIDHSPHTSPFIVNSQNSPYDKGLGRKNSGIKFSYPEQNLVTISGKVITRSQFSRQDSNNSNKISEKDEIEQKQKQLQSIRKTKKQQTIQKQQNELKSSQHQNESVQEESQSVKKDSFKRNKSKRLSITGVSTLSSLQYGKNKLKISQSSVNNLSKNQEQQELQNQNTRQGSEDIVIKPSFQRFQQIPQQDSKKQTAQVDLQPQANFTTPQTKKIQFEEKIDSSDNNTPPQSSQKVKKVFTLMQINSALKVDEEQLAEKQRQIKQRKSTLAAAKRGSKFISPQQRHLLQLNKAKNANLQQIQQQEGTLDSQLDEYIPKIFIAESRRQNVRRKFLEEAQHINQKVLQFKNIIYFMDQQFIDQNQNLQEKEEKLVQFIERYIWETISKTIFFDIDDSHQYVQLNIGGQKFDIHEQMFDNTVIVDKNTELCIEISIDLIEIVHLGNKIMGFNNGNEITFQTDLGEVHSQAISNNSNSKSKQNKDKVLQLSANPFLGNKQQKSKIKNSIIDFYFLPFEFIPYTITSSFKFAVKNFNIQKARVQVTHINMKEIINFFIADGFFKFPTNYLNSRLSYSEIRNICFYLVHKIKSSGILEMMEKKQDKSLFENEDDLDDQGEDFLIENNPLAKKTIIKLGRKNFIFSLEKFISVENKLVLKSQYFTKDKQYTFQVYQLGTNHMIKAEKDNAYFLKISPLIFNFYALGKKFHLMIEKAAIIMQEQLIETFKQKYNFNYLEQEDLIQQRRNEGSKSSVSSSSYSKNKQKMNTIQN